MPNFKEKKHFKKWSVKQYLEKKSDLIQDFITKKNSRGPKDLETSAFYYFLCPDRIQ